MANILDDNTVIPSWQGLRPAGFAEASSHFDNNSLRQGEVKAIVLPEAEESISKKYIEYTVEIQQRDSTGPGATTLYYGCLLMNMFGGAADKLTFTLRPDAKGNASGIGTGSKVLLLCMNGETSKAWIIGGVRSDAGQEKEAAGHNLLFEFNGVRAIINKDGAFEINFNGATTAKGELAEGVEKSKGGSFVQLNKDGDLTFAHDDQTLILNHKEQSWRMKAKKAISEETDGEWSAIAQKTGYLAGKQSLDLQSEGTITATGKNVKIGSDSAKEHLVLGDTYRQGESQLMQAMLTNLQTMSTTLQTLMSAVTTAGTALKIPITGGILASPSFAIMSAQLQVIGQTISTMVSDIESFEGEAATYLSDNHTTE